MYQLKSKNLVRVFVMSALLVLSVTACSKKPTGVKAQVKTQQNNLNPSVSSAADQQAASLNANYQVKSVSTPQANSSGGYQVDLEISDPSGAVLPVSTTHDSTHPDSQGIYNDTQRGLQVYVQARCSTGDQCFKYILLVTVVKNNQSVYQSMAVSYANDCRFNLITSSGTIGTFFGSLSEAAGSPAASISPRNDINTCTQ